MTPGLSHFYPRGMVSGFIKRTTTHCYTQNNMKAVGLVVLEQKISLFSHCMSMGANDPPEQGCF